MRDLRSAAAAARTAVAVVISALLIVACGGDGGDALPQPTPLPQTLAVSMLTAQPAVAEVVQFSSNASGPAGALTYNWNFGDGTSSTLASRVTAIQSPARMPFN